VKIDEYFKGVKGNFPKNNFRDSILRVVLFRRNFFCSCFSYMPEPFYRFLLTRFI
jgi:hypothetical protein